MHPTRVCLFFIVIVDMAIDFAKWGRHRRLKNANWIPFSKDQRLRFENWNSFSKWPRFMRLFCWEKSIITEHDPTMDHTPTSAMINCALHLLVWAIGTDWLVWFEIGGPPSMHTSMPPQCPSHPGAGQAPSSAYGLQKGLGYDLASGSSATISEWRMWVLLEAQADGNGQTGPMSLKVVSSKFGKIDLVRRRNVFYKRAFVIGWSWVLQGGGLGERHRSWRQNDQSCCEQDHPRLKTNIQKFSRSTTIRNESTT